MIRPEHLIDQTFRADILDFRQDRRFLLLALEAVADSVVNQSHKPSRDNNIRHVFPAAHDSLVGDPHGARGDPAAFGFLFASFRGREGDGEDVGEDFLAAGADEVEGDFWRAAVVFSLDDAFP